MTARRQFLKGDFHAAETVRPPWSREESQFIEHCTRCYQCLDTCPTGIITVGDGGYPSVDFSRGECLFCTDCVYACDVGALSQFNQMQGQSPWQLELRINQQCLPNRQVICRVCSEHCEQRAIHFVHSVGSVCQPFINQEACNGCGACIAPCPAQAMSLQPIQSIEAIA